MVQKNRNTRKRYVAIVKINNNQNGSAYCVKYRFDNLIIFTKFLDEKWPEWKWFNVYSNKGNNKKKQLSNFTKNKRPKEKFV